AARTGLWTIGFRTSAILLSMVPLSVSSAYNQITSARTKAARGPADEGAASIRGQVVDNHGQPFANVVVSVYSVGAEYGDVREVAADENGVFRVNGLPRKPYEVNCSAAGFVEDHQDGSSAYHLTGDFVELRLLKGGVLTGRVTGPSGEPLIKAEVEALRTRD